MSDAATKADRNWPDLDALEPLDDGAPPLLPLVPEADRPTHGDAGRRGVVVG